MKGKKSIVLAAVLILAFSMVIAGCGSGKNNEAQSPASESPGASSATASQTPSESAKPELKPYVIDWYLIGNGPQPDNELVEAEINKIIQPKTNATIKMHIIGWGDYDTKMTTLLATGEKVDLMFTSFGNMNYLNMIAKGAYVDLTDKLDTLAPDAKKLLSDGFLQASEVNGRNYTLAAYKEKAAGLGIVANKDLLDKYGYDVNQINSLEDMEPILQTIKEKEPDYVPLWAIGATNAPAFMNRNLWNASPIKSLVLNKEGTAYTSALDEPEYMNTLQTMRKYYEAGYVPKDAAVIKSTPKGQKFGFRLAQLTPYVEVQVSIQSNAKIVQRQFGKPITTTNDLVGSMMAIPTNSKDPDRALMFMNMMYSDPELINLVGRGIEGKHYVKVDGGKIDFAPDTEGGTKSGYNPNTTWEYGNQFLSYLMKDEPSDRWEKFKQFNDEAEITPNLGFNFDGESVKTEVGAIANVEAEYRAILETGSVDPNEFVPKFKDKLKSAGIDKVLDEMNKQYAAFLAAKK